MEARTGGKSVRMVRLQPHPGTTGSPATQIEVDVVRLDVGRLILCYRLYGDLARVRLPDAVDPARAGRADQLWRHTCFEAFIGKASAAGYLEFNFSPWLQWAAYRFSDYRAGMTAANVAPWIMHGGSHADHLALEVEIDPGSMVRPDLPAPDWRVGLSAVIEDVDGTLSYWALAHPSDKPDFHHPDSFTLTLPPPEPA